MFDRTLLSLGLFVFGMDSLAFAEIDRRMNWRHATSERFGARAASQFAGPGEDAITLTGVLVPEVAGSWSALTRIEEMAATGDQWPLVDGDGRVLGVFRILSLDTRGSGILPGGWARKTEFTLALERAADPEPGGGAS